MYLNKAIIIGHFLWVQQFKFYTSFSTSYFTSSTSATRIMSSHWKNILSIIPQKRIIEYSETVSLPNVN